MSREVARVGKIREDFAHRSLTGVAVSCSTISPIGSVKFDDKHMILTGPLSMAGVRALESLVSQPVIRNELLDSEAEVAANAPLRSLQDLLGVT